jgi:hypothetical protein
MRAIHEYRALPKSHPHIVEVEDDHPLRTERTET